MEETMTDTIYLSWSPWDLRLGPPGHVPKLGDTHKVKGTLTVTEVREGLDGTRGVSVNLLIEDIS